REGRRTQTSSRWGAAPGWLPILRPESVSRADRAQAPSYKMSVQLEIITVECGGFVPREVGERFVVIDRGAQLVPLGRCEISLEVEHKACGAEPNFQALLLRLQLLLCHDSGRTSCFNPFKIRLYAPDRFAHTHDNLLLHTHEGGLSVLLLQLTFVVRTPG